MSPEEYDAIRNQVPREKDPSLSVHDLPAGPDRTLAYGYTCERQTWHAYIWQGALHVAIYGNDRVKPVLHQHWNRWCLPVSRLVPDKRVYPHYTDAEFAKAMLALGRSLPYTNFDQGKYAQAQDRTFHGFVFNENDQVVAGRN